MVACKTGVDMVETLLDSGLFDVNDISFCARRLYTPLLLSCTNGNIEMARFLLRYPNIDVNLGNGVHTPLTICIQKNFKEIFDLLLSHPDININKRVLGEIKDYQSGESMRRFENYALREAVRSEREYYVLAILSRFDLKKIEYEDFEILRSESKVSDRILRHIVKNFVL